MKETFIIVMPAYNEEKNIERTISSWVPIIKNHPGSEILVINDGSKDKTADKLQGLAAKYKFLKIIHKKNEGHGKTILLGYKKAISSSHDWIFQTDSDGHFDPNDFYKLWGERKLSNCILGHRHKRKDGLHRIILSHLISIWIFILFGKYIKDPNIPFRLIKRTYLKEAIKIIPEGVFAPNIFLSILAAKHGYNLHHIPVKHKSTKKSHSNALKILKGALQGFAQLTLFGLRLI